MGPLLPRAVTLASAPGSGVPARLTVARRTRWLVLASLAAGTGTILGGIGLMGMSGLLISRAAERPPILDLIVLFVAVRFFGLLRPALRYAERLASHDVTFRMLLAVRCWFYQALVPLAPARLIGFRSGDLLSRVADDVESLQDAYLRVAAPAVVAGAVSAVVIAGLALVDARLAAAVLLLLAANGLAAPAAARRLARGLGERRNEQRGALAAHLVTTLQGLEDALAFGHEGDSLSRVAAHQRALDEVERRHGLRLACNAAAGAAVSGAALWISLALTVAVAVTGGIPPVWIAALVLGVLAAFEAVEPLPNAWQFRDQVEDAGRRVLQVIETPPAVTDPARARMLQRHSPPAVVFDRVSFAHDGQRPVFRELSFVVEPGEHVLVTGPTGVGKSTLLQLLVRVWDPASGRITIGGVDLRDVRLRDLRTAMAVLPQEVHVFNETLRDNLRLARPPAADAELTVALERAGLRGFLDGLPGGLDTYLGEHGTRMSAGERQRLGLARVLLTDARLVLVDEPTAHLDPEHERAVFETLAAWGQGRTLLVATHRDPSGVGSRVSGPRRPFTRRIEL